MTMRQQHLGMPTKPELPTRALLILLAFHCCLHAVPLEATEATEASSNTEAKNRERLVSSYCGLRCLYSVMRLEDVSAGFLDLVKPKYLGSRMGSSIGELKQAAQDFGLYAIPVKKLGSSDLRRSRTPIVLHVKSHPESTGYDHYVLFLGDENGQALLFDPPKPIRREPYYKLASRWDGAGLILSADPIDMSKVIAPARRNFMLVVILIVGAVALLKVLVERLAFSVNRYQLLCLSVAQCLCLTSLVLSFALVYHRIDNEGFLAHADATEPIQQAHLTGFMPKVNAGDVERLMQHGAVVIDARYEWDFKEGHIPRAINISTNSRSKDRKEVFGAMKKDRKLVVYCQSSQCPYASIVARRLVSDGFRDICIYRKGWVDWVARNGRPEEAAI